MMTHVQLYIDGQWRDGASGKTLDFWNPVNGEVIGTVAKAEQSDLEEAVAAAERAFRSWRSVSAYDRSALLRKAAGILRSRLDEVATLLVREEGKPLAEAKGEVAASADIIEWFAEEGRRTYGRLIPARAETVQQLVVREPVGPVAAFSPWNFPVAQAVRKIAAALACGCTIILKGPEETPACCAALVQAFAAAGLPKGTLALVYGVPAEISQYLIPHPAIRKVSFTGSTAVGKQLASLAGLHMKRVTMELGGHAPAIVFDDADIAKAVDRLGAFKYRNAGQVCGAPTRFLVQERVYDAFLEGFVAYAQAIKVGDGMEPDTRMGPLANPRRVDASLAFVEDAVKKGARLACGGARIGNRGNFFQPTVLADVPVDANVMNQEPFAPIAIVNRFSEAEDALAEANRLQYGLASYVFTESHARAQIASAGIEAGMVSINHAGLGLVETPFGGVKDSGYGSEGGLEAMEPYLVSKFVTHARI
ncbi:NAD-dependent succinate-semialdehyde dehydrogenase [Chelativorans sp. SCAU2101]|uniref:NAD-dependent succinate-semialdehyde dehydrogenase n=2 Tax=Chelativorans petroleitrophicus TaxID=2975484 RepID=A0A9X3B6A4_9HYPH|nr:NAD-dependent succinate-semialdehyde dehydrogenase [Chelativorans petroleitrophicus]